MNHWMTKTKQQTFLATFIPVFTFLLKLSYGLVDCVYERTFYFHEYDGQWLSKKEYSKLAI